MFTATRSTPNSKKKLMDLRVSDIAVPAAALVKFARSLCEEIEFMNAYA